MLAPPQQAAGRVQSFSEALHLGIFDQPKQKCSFNFYTPALAVTKGKRLTHPCLPFTTPAIITSTTPSIS
jgi:hypothetical protein